MKTRYAVIMYIAGLLLSVVGALFKVLHFAGTNEIFIVSTALQIVGGIWFLVKLITYPKFRDFLNW